MKKLMIATMIMAAMGISCSAYAWPSSSRLVRPMRGDVNRDGKLGLADLAMAKQCAVGKTPRGADCRMADMNGDGRISALDISKLRNALVNR